MLSSIKSWSLIARHVMKIITASDDATLNNTDVGSKITEADCYISLFSEECDDTKAEREKTDRRKKRFLADV